MHSDTPVRIDELEIEGRQYLVLYWQSTTASGGTRYSSEVLLGPADRVILDGCTMSDVESKVVRLVPATIYSRLLAARCAAA